MPPRGSTGKRKRVSESTDTASPPSRRSRHVENSHEASEVPTPRRSTRASTDAPDSAPRRRPGPQLARRSGGRLPPKSKSRADAYEGMPPPKSRVVVEIPTAQPSPPPAPTRIALSASLASRSSQGAPSTPAQRTPRTPASRRKRVVSAESSSFSDSEVDELESEEDDNGAVGGAGPGPRTRAIRKSRNLRPVPQPEPEVFHQYMEPKKRRPTRNSLSAKASLSSVPDSQEASQIPNRPITMVDGEEAYVIADSDSDNGVGEFECPMNRCGVACRTGPAMADHIRDHASMYDSSDGQTSLATARKKIAELEKQRKAQQKAHAEAVSKLSKLEDENEQNRLRLNEYISRTAIALGTASQTQAKLKEKETAEEEHRKEAEMAKSQLAALTVQIAERDTKLASLQHKMDAFDKLDEELAEISAMPAPLAGEVPSHEHQIKILHKKLKSKTSALKNAESESEFLRDQYKTASDSAVAEVARANKLEDEVKKLSERLAIGLKQRDLHSTNVAKEAEKAKELAEAQLDLLLEQSRRTDDALRRKATSYSRLTREVQDLETELHKARSRADDLAKRNTELSDHITLLRGRLMGAFDAAEESGNETDDEVPAVAPTAPPAIANLGPAFAPDNNSTRPSPALADTTLADGGIEMFRCKWALDGDIMCPEIFHTRDELEAHGMGHIEKLSAAIIDVPELA